MIIAYAILMMASPLVGFAVCRLYEFLYEISFPSGLSEGGAPNKEWIPEIVFEGRWSIPQVCCGNGYAVVVGVRA